MADKTKHIYDDFFKKSYICCVFCLYYMCQPFLTVQFFSGNTDGNLFNIKLLDFVKLKSKYFYIPHIEHSHPSNPPFPSVFHLPILLANSIPQPLLPRLPPLLWLRQVSIKDCRFINSLPSQLISLSSHCPPTPAHIPSLTLLSQHLGDGVGRVEERGE